MTAPDIRAQAIEALKAHQPHEDIYLYCTCGVQLADDGFPAHVYESSAAEAPHMWLRIEQGDDIAAHLTVDQARTVRDQISAWLERATR